MVSLFRLFERLPLDVNGVVGRYFGANRQGSRAVGRFGAYDRGRSVVAFGCVAMRTEVVDVVRQSRTVLTLDKVEYNIPIDKDEFTLECLKRQ